MVIAIYNRNGFMANILLVDDDAVLLKLYSTRLAADGHKVVTASDGEQALQTMVSSTPDVIVLDLLMPKLNGFDFIAQLNQKPQTQAIPKIVFSSVSKQEQVERLQTLGIKHTLNKTDVSPTQLVEIINQEIAKKVEVPVPTTV